MIRTPPPGPNTQRGKEGEGQYVSFSSSAPQVSNVDIMSSAQNGEGRECERQFVKKDTINLTNGDLAWDE